MTESKNCCTDCSNKESCPGASESYGPEVVCFWRRSHRPKGGSFELFGDSTLFHAGTPKDVWLGIDARLVANVHDETQVNLEETFSAVSILKAELKDVTEHNDALVKENNKLIKKAERDKNKIHSWKEASAQLALEHNQLIEHGDKMAEEVSFLARRLFLERGANGRFTALQKELMEVSKTSMNRQEEAKRNKEAEIVALEMLGASRKKLKEAKTRLGVSRCITAAVVILAVVCHYFIRG